jgi:hypothetical protein
MTTTAGDVDLQNRVRLTFGDAEEKLGLDELIGTLDQIERLCVAVNWLVAYDEGVPLARRYFEDPRIWGAEETLRRSVDSLAVNPSPLVSPLLPARFDRKRQGFVWPLFQSTTPAWTIPTVPRLTKQSPLVLDLVVQAVPWLTSGVVTTVLIAALKNPENVGAWLPSVAEGWHRGRAKMLRSKLEASIAERENEVWLQPRPPESVVADDLEVQDSLARELRYSSGHGSPHDQAVFAHVEGDRDAQIMQAMRAAQGLRRNGLSLVQDQPIEERHEE